MRPLPSCPWRFSAMRQDLIVQRPAGPPRPVGRSTLHTPSIQAEVSNVNYSESVLDLVGDTPLVRLNKWSNRGKATVLAKMENLNPTGSVKDRMAVNMVKHAEEQGLLKPGGTLVESTSGNTGLGLAMAAAAKGYRCIFTIPDKMSQEKIDMLKAYGAEVIVTPTDLDHHHPDSYVEVAKRISAQTPGAFYTDPKQQHVEPGGPLSHHRSRDLGGH
ncbi:MAG: hypothetical protein CM1200mP20_08300 [Pseudomonadota bacterium]|nr:MAG: hypothetical protein CM1200mP20_08300 [Pseudomonadota bacterium]